MKIAYLTAQFPYGSGEQFFEPEIRMLSQLGAEVLVVPARPRLRNGAATNTYLSVLRLSAFGVRTLCLAAAEAASNAPRSWRALRLIFSSKYSLMTKCKNAALFPKALAVARELRREGVQHIHAQWLSTPSTIGYVASIATDIPWSCTAHQFDILQNNLLAQKVASAQFVRVISSRNRDLVLSKVPFAASRCKVVHLGVSVPHRTQGQANNRVSRILCAANFVPKKGHTYLISALAMLRERGIAFECDFAGNGPLRTAIEMQIEKSGLRSQIRLRGNVPHEQLCAEMKGGRYDLFVLASTEDAKEFEGIPVALMEAMAAAMPCVATRTGSIPELIEDGVSSRLVDQRDAASLADAISELALDTELRNTVGRRARERVLQYFDTRKTTKELFDLISDCQAAPA